MRPQVLGNRSDRRRWPILISGLVGVFLLFFGQGGIAAAQTNATLPVAVSVPLSGASGAGGALVVYDEDAQTYALASVANSADVFGVTVATPPLVFETATDTIPVVTSGSVYVQVTDANGQINRGDLLVSAGSAGLAAKAGPEQDHVFGMALQDAPAGEATILAQFDPRSAKALLSERRAAAEAAAEAERAAGEAGGATDAEEAAEERGPIAALFATYTRNVLAFIIAVGSLVFLMYTFRSTIINATLAVGRNPRARNAIMTVSVENIIFALIICAVAIFLAIAVLVLPV